LTDLEKAEAEYELRLALAIKYDFASDYDKAQFFKHALKHLEMWDLEEIARELTDIEL
jgi:hypothetical protein